MTSEAAAPRKYYLPEGLPAPAPAADGLGVEFWEGARRHELLVQRCDKCSKFQWGPEWICHHCHSFDLGWERVSGRGRIFSWERAWYPVHPKLSGALPYVVVLVELADAGNIRMVGNLLGDPEQEIVIGAPVEVAFEDHDDAAPAPFTLVHWRRA